MQCSPDRPWAPRRTAPQPPSPPPSREGGAPPPPGPISRVKANPSRRPASPPSQPSLSRCAWRESVRPVPAFAAETPLALAGPTPRTPRPAAKGRSRRQTGTGVPPRGPAVWCGGSSPTLLMTREDETQSGRTEEVLVPFPLHGRRPSPDRGPWSLLP